MSNDFLDLDLPTDDAPQLPAATLPFFQFHNDQAVFEFPVEIKEKQGNKFVEKPLWSAILAKTSLKPQKLNHNGKKTMAYAFEQIHFCYLGEHVYWYDHNNKVPGRFRERPNPLPEGTRFVSRRLIVGLVKEIEAVAPGTLCFLTVSSSQSKFLSRVLQSFDKTILLAAHQARLAQLREKNPSHPEPQTMLYPRYAFWTPIKSGEAENVSPEGKPEKWIPPIIGDWNPEGETLDKARELYVGNTVLAGIQRDWLPEAKRWIAAQEARWMTGETTTPNIEAATDDNTADTDDTIY